MNNESECFTGISKHEKIMVNARARRASVFAIIFECLDIPGGRRARVVHMVSQMNQDVTGCFGLLI